MLLAVAVLIADVAVLVARSDGDDVAVPALARMTGTETTTTTAPPPPTTAPPTTPPPTSAPPLAPTTPPAPPPPAPTTPLLAAALPVTAFDLTPYVGLGTWVDVYDWSRTYGRGDLVGPAHVDQMAAVGVQTLYLQASKWDAPTDVLDPDLLLPIIRRAHQHGIRVVVWYLPTLVDPGADLRRLVAIAGLDVEGVAVDIEARDVADVTERNRRLVELSVALRQALPGRALGAIVLPPVQIEDLNPRYWSPFPYAELAPLYDVWLTMGYWTFRSHGWRDAYRYTFENVARLRRNLGRPDLPVHPIGGIGDRTTIGDVEGFVRAAYDQHVLGGSLYDWRTTAVELWPAQQPFRGG